LSATNIGGRKKEIHCHTFIYLTEYQTGSASFIAKPTCADYIFPLFVKQNGFGASPPYTHTHISVQAAREKFMII